MLVNVLQRYIDSAWQVAGLVGVFIADIDKDGRILVIQACGIGCADGMTTAPEVHDFVGDQGCQYHQQGADQQRIVQTEFYDSFHNSALLALVNDRESITVEIDLLMKALIFLLCLFLPAMGLAETADQIAEREARLDALRGEIRQLEEQLSNDRARAGGLEAELAGIEQRIGDERAELRRLDARIVEQTQSIATLQASVDEELARSEQHRAFLAATIRAAYRRGPEEPLRLLLGESDSAVLQRLIEYQRRLGSARAERVREAEAAMRSLQARQDELAQALAEQRQVRDERERGLGQLQASLGQREAVLDSLRQRIQTEDEALTARQQEAQSLQSLIADLQTRLEDAGPLTGELPTMAPGALAWPVQGPLLARYGAERAVGLRWTGLLIGGDAGDPVYPVAAGQVVFADWLRGLGLLLIIDHGDGYLSLYGRNQALYFAVGDWVDPGDVIATVGNSGGRPETALYFELRSGGEPIDPLAWLRANGNRG